MLEETFWDYSYTPLFADDGSVGGLLNISQGRYADRACGTRIAEKIRKSFQLGMDSAGLGMWHYDPKTKVMVADERMHRIFGSPELNGVVDYWLNLLNPEDRERAGAHFCGSPRRQASLRS